MEEERNDINVQRSDEILMPGFRFHPTDEELVSFYLRRKIQQKPISIELIRQLDIYKYDPWDLPSKKTPLSSELDLSVDACLGVLSFYELIRQR